MSKFVAAIEINRHHESKDDQIERLTRQLRTANARNAKAFDEGAAMVIRALRNGAQLEDLARKVRWEALAEPLAPRTVTQEWDDTARIAIPLELEDSDEYTEPMAAIPLAPK